MARTRASVGAKMSSAKSAKARAVSSSSGSSSYNGTSGSNEKSRSHSGGNPVCPRETPKWQKPITGFLLMKEKQHSVEIEDDQGSTSQPKRRTRNIILSDDENETDDIPRNSVLDESIELEQLSGENSHKIEEYYKDLDNKEEKINDKEALENDEEMEVEIEDKENRRKSVKRDLELSNDDVQDCKRVRTESD